MSGTNAPLADLKVLELGHVVAAPYATLMLSDLGAEVVKIEHPDHGDHMRVAGETGQAIFAALNRDKLGVTLDLKNDIDREAFLELVQETDVVVENFAPGSMDALGLGYDILREVNSGLIYVSIKGFDTDGPYADRTATDPIVQAMSGIMSVTGHQELPPARAGTSVVDISTAQNAVVATTLALRRHSETGEGEYVTVPMFQTSIALMGYWMAYYQMFDRDPQRMGASHSLYAPYNVYPTAEGYVFIGATSDAHWKAIQEELDLSLDYDDRGTRLKNREHIDKAITDATGDRSRSALINDLLSKDVPAAPVNEISDLMADPHLTAVDGLTTVDTASTDDVVLPWTIPWMSASDEGRDPPALGSDSETVFDRLDYDTTGSPEDTDTRIK